MKKLIVCVLGCATVVLVTAAAVLEERAEYEQSERSDLVKRFLWCDKGWTKINGACFELFQTPTTWAKAEKNCRSTGAHLASVQSISEYNNILKMMSGVSHDYKEAWIGGSDAQEESIWFWTDGSDFKITNWCQGEPNNAGGKQHCLQMVLKDQKCWEDFQCNALRPYVCAKRGGFWG